MNEIYSDRSAKAEPSGVSSVITLKDEHKNSYDKFYERMKSYRKMCPRFTIGTIKKTINLK